MRQVAFDDVPAHHNGSAQTFSSGMGAKLKQELQAEMTRLKRARSAASIDDSAQVSSESAKEELERESPAETHHRRQRQSLNKGHTEVVPEVHELRPEMLADARARLVSGLKRYFHQKRIEGLLSSTGMRVLDNACDVSIDNAEEPLALWEILEK
eukprot:jgi/Astpho2/6187/Aster-x0275